MPDAEQVQGMTSTSTVRNFPAMTGDRKSHGSSRMLGMQERKSIF